MCGIWKKKQSESGLGAADFAFLPGSIRSVNLTGGEPFLNNQIIEIVKTIKAKLPEVKIIISTNGFATELIISKMEKIIAIDPNIGVAVSLDGIGKTYDDIRGAPGGFNSAVATLKKLKKLGVKNLKIAFTLGDYNPSELIKVYRLAGRIGAEFSLAAVHSSDNFFSAKNRFEKKGLAAAAIDSVIAAELSGWNFKKWARAYFAFGLKYFILSGKRILPDYSGRSNVFIDPYGDIYPSDISTEKIGRLKNGFFVRKPKDKIPASWMVCTAREAIKNHPFKAIFWILKQKLIFIFGRGYARFVD